MTRMLEAAEENVNCDTSMQHRTLNYVWTINDFSQHLQNENMRWETTIYSDATMKWVLKLFPNGDGYRPNQFSSIYLILQSSCLPYILVREKYSIIDKDGNKSIILNSDVEIKFTEGAHICRTQFMKRDRILKLSDLYLPDDTLTLLCELDLFLNQSERIDLILNDEIPECELKKHVSCMIEDRKFVDVIFLVENKELYAHKMLLVARSPVFSAMFSNDMIEKNHKKVEVNGFRFEVFREMLHFIYTGECLNLSYMARDLLEISDYYSIDRLKLMAEKKLSESFTIENVIEILIMADRLSGAALKKCALKFICSRNFQRIKETEGWNSLMRKEIDLMSEIFANLSSAIEANY